MSNRPTAYEREPLRAWRQFHSRDIDEARTLVARRFCDHRLQLSGKAHGFGTRYNHLPGNNLSLNYLNYGTDVAIDPGELQDFYLVQLPLSGRAQVSNGTGEVASDRETATVLNPTRTTRMTWQADCRMLLLQIDRAALHGLAERTAGLPLPEEVVFSTAVPLTEGSLVTWVRQLAACVHACDANAGFGHWSALQQQVIEEQLVLGLLTQQESNIRHLLTPRASASSSHVRRAQEFIHAHASEPLTVSAIAAEAGCSIRSLQTAFRRQFGQSPVGYLQNLRLDIARYRLLSRPADTRISSIAYDCGFSHLGRFSQAYRARFGELPSTTRTASGIPAQSECSPLARPKHSV